MSGNDERSIDFPTCPNCGKNHYWVGRIGQRHLGVCFNTKKYLKCFINQNVLIVNDSRLFEIDELDTVNDLRCEECSWRADEQISAVIIMLAKKYFRLRRNDVWK
jgi:hypothetical protein